MPVRAGDLFVCVGPAGGGYGDPFGRDPEAVRADVLDSLLSAEAARRDYGVVIAADGTVDAAATAAARARAG
jgi:N-methylhydantoinase B